MEVLTASEAHDSWRERAACRYADHNLFFHPEGRGSKSFHAEALEYCGRCPVVDECWDFAEQYQLDYGVFGGKVRETLVRRSQRTEATFPRPGSLPSGENWCGWCGRSLPTPQMWVMSGTASICRDCGPCRSRAVYAAKRDGFSKAEAYADARVLCAEHRWGDNRSRAENRGKVVV